MTGRLLNPDLLAAVVWSLICFGLGVAYAAYRAVGWVERIRSWASSAHIEERTH